MRIMRLILVLALVALSATAAHAQITGPTQRAMMWDYSLQTRYIGGHTNDGEGGSKTEFSDDLGWGFGFGYNVDERFVIGGIISWRSVSYAATVVPEDVEEDDYTYSNWLDTATFGLYGDWNILPKRLTPYVTGGIGWTLIDTNVSAGYSGGCYWDPWWGYVCGSYPTTFGTDAFSYSIGAGIRLEASETVMIRVGYEYDGVDAGAVSGMNTLRVDFGLM